MAPNPTTTEPVKQPIEPRINEGARRQFWSRVLHVLWLDPRVFDEVENDPSALLQAALIVVAAGLARGVFGLSGELAVGVLGSVAGAIVLWFLATGLLTAVGVHWLHGTSDFSELLRTVGFAAVPLWFLAPAYYFAGSAHTAAGIAVHLWAVAAAVVAVRQALDLGTARAFVACGLSLLLAIGLIVLIGVPS